MRNDVRNQLVLGLLHGDSRTWAAARQRLNLVPPKRRMRMRYLDEFSEVRSQSSLPVPYLHSTHESVLNPLGPADVSEWFFVSFLSTAGLSLDLAESACQQIWHDLAMKRKSDKTNVRGRIGTTLSLETIARTTSFETSGKDNPHYFDDLALIRAVAVTLATPEDKSLSDSITRELSVTSSHDGLSAGIAAGLIFQKLLSGDSPKEAIAAALDQVPSESWTHSVVVEALGLASQATSADELGYLLEREIADHVYSYQVSAPETLAMFCAYLVFCSSRSELLLAGFLNSSRSEVLVPLLWSACGLLFGGFADSPGALQGLSIRQLKGLHLDKTLSEIAQRVPGRLTQ